MKKILLFVLLLIVGFSSGQEPINIDELDERDEMVYTKDTNEPYSGTVFLLYNSEQKEKEINYKDGKKDGKWTSWYENGQKWSEGTYKDGYKDGLWTVYNIYLKGQKKSEEIYKDGNRIYYKRWDKDGNLIE